MFVGLATDLLNDSAPHVAKGVVSLIEVLGDMRACIGCNSRSVAIEPAAEVFFSFGNFRFSPECIDPEAKKSRHCGGWNIWISGFGDIIGGRPSGNLWSNKNRRGDSL